MPEFKQAMPDLDAKQLVVPPTAPSATPSGPEALEVAPEREAGVARAIETAPTPKTQEEETTLAVATETTIAAGPAAGAASPKITEKAAVAAAKGAMQTADPAALADEIAQIREQLQRQETDTGPSF
ncbi:MAG: hypothetical protein A2788_01020 [Candidatus Abawacabacteria bacterium RIFCSPHIGHO2_01_FULL_46_8]|uniref:Uncharacterized protein n=1 Tax=Candidatus Abawacabacteria bacterium RIFCSPHIGHO2_01_FULL_46_8 TaxID=1817815 RepID=A0A1F4XJL7_9BACT|nr:MAG: hypothetical protein A2788_01020 [Candidatus Abawacabacteria bacterium RIFCSPHIGHO2_01_FULL_46_8]